MKRIAITILLSILACAVQATDYYVSSIRTGRSDSNAGTSSTAPWATFTKVMQAWGTTIKAGDTVHLERGSLWDYSLSSDWRLPAGGNASAGPMTIRGDDYGSGALPMLRRSSGVAIAACFWIRDFSYITLRDFVLDGGSVQGVNSTGVLVGSAGQAGNISNINVLNLTMQNLANSSSYYVSAIYVAAWNNYTISDCLIEGNSVSGFNGEGLNHYSQKTTAKNQSLLNRITWRNNHVFGANAAHYGAIGSGIHIGFGGSGNVFEYNLVEGNEFIASCFLMNVANDESGLIIRYNVFKGNNIQSAMIFLYDSNGAAGCKVQADVYGNIFTGALYDGLWMYVNAYYTGSVNIYNNTFYDNNRAGTSAWGNGGEIQCDSTAGGVNLTIRNNLIYVAEPNTYGLYVRSGYTGTIVHDHNLYWNSSGSSGGAINYNGTTYTVANVKNYEATAQNTDPHLTNLAQPPTSLSDTAGTSPNGFVPLAGSPAIDTGATLGAAYAKDINGVVRPQGSAWDIGAYETGGSAPPPVVLAAPSLLTATALSTSSIGLAWKDNSTNETGFQVQRSTDGVTFTNLFRTAANATSWTDAGLLSSRTYYYRVCAMDGTPSAYTAVSQATTPALTDTTPPTLVSAAAAGDPTRVILVFSESVNPATAAAMTNYDITGPINITAATCTQNVVTLSVAPAFSDLTSYTLTVNNVRDLIGNVIAGPAQITFTYRALDPSLLAWFTFEGDASDHSGHGNNATLSGASIATGGRIGQALQFSSIADYLQVPLSGMTVARGTVALWAQAASFPASPQYLFGQSAPTAWTNTIQIYISPTTGQLNLGMGAQHDARLNLDTLVTQQWYHVALTWDGTNYMFYGNGVLRGSGPYAGLSALPAFADVGNDGRATSRTEGFLGRIDDVRLYNRPLTAAEVMLLATPVEVPAPPPTVWTVP